MSTNFQFKRGTTAALSAVTGLAGELMVDLTKNTVVVHDGVTAGGHALALEGAGGTVDLSAYSTTTEMNTAISTATTGLASTSYVDTAIAGVSAGAPDLSAASVGDLGDVDTTTAAPTSGQALVWDGTNWTPGTVAGAGGDADTLDGLDSTAFLRTDGGDDIVQGRIEFQKGLWANSDTRNGWDKLDGFFLQPDGASAVMSPLMHNRLAYGRLASNGFVTGHTTTGRSTAFADYEVDYALSPEDDYMSIQATDFVDANTDVIFEINFGALQYDLVAGVVFGGPRSGFGPSYCKVEAFSEGAWVQVEEDTAMYKNMVGGRVSGNQGVGTTALRITMRKDTALYGANEVRITSIFASKNGSPQWALMTRGGGNVYGHIDAKSNLTVEGTTTLNGSLAITNQQTFDVDLFKDNMYGSGNGRRVSATSFGQGSQSKAMHDIAAFYHTRNTVTQELLTAGTWAADTTVHTGLFAGKQNAIQSIINATDVTNGVTAARWTFQGGFAWSSLGSMLVGYQYMASPITATVIVESSADAGVTWTTRHNSTHVVSSAGTYEHGIGYIGGDSWLRVTIETDDVLTLSNISLMTARVGDTGIGKEVEVPYEWDADRNINFLGNVDVAGTFTVGGQPVSGGSGLTAWTAVTTDTTVAAGDRVLVDTTAGAVVITLPASPTLGMEVNVIDAGNNAATNNITVAGNGSNIQHQATDMVVATNAAAFQLVYAGAVGWVLANN